MTSRPMSGYEGWSNYATWNAWLWLNNEQPVYQAMIDYLDGSESPTYRSLIAYLRANDIIRPETPDGIYWLSSDLNLDELDEALRETSLEHIRPS